MSTISVIIPNYNRAALIGETLENFLRQTRAPDELIVVDDGSTDESVAEIRRFGERVRLIRQANAGAAAARNRGLAEATGDFIQFFDSDDLCSLNKLEIQARALNETGGDWAYGPWLTARLKGGDARYPEHPAQLRPLPPARSALAWFLRGWMILLQSCLFRRQLIERVGPFRTDLRVAEDLDLLFRVLATGARPVHTPESLTLYRMHDGPQLSQGGTDPARQADDWLVHCRTVAEMVAAGAATGATPEDAAYWRRTLREAEREADRAHGRPTAPALDPVALADHAAARLRRWRAGLSRRLRGTSLPPPFSVARLDSAQCELVRRIGYEPVPELWAART